MAQNGFFQYRNYGFKFVYYIFVTVKGKSVIPNLNINVRERDIILSFNQVI
jgi:hypothetical protein